MIVWKRIFCIAGSKCRYKNLPRVLFLRKFLQDLVSEFSATFYFPKFLSEFLGFSPFWGFLKSSSWNSSKFYSKISSRVASGILQKVPSCVLSGNLSGITHRRPEISKYFCDSSRNFSKSFFWNSWTSFLWEFPREFILLILTKFHLRILLDLCLEVSRSFFWEILQEYLLRIRQHFL